MKRISIILITLIIIITLIINNQSTSYINSIPTLATPPKISVLLRDSNAQYISLIKQSLENIQKENPDKVNFSFYDAMNNQSIQNATIDNLVNDSVDLLLINLVDTNPSTVSDIIDKATSKNIPIIFFNVQLQIAPNISSNKVVVITNDSKVPGIMQGQIIADLWKNNRDAIDKNNDNILQYIMLQGQANNEAAINRTLLSVSTINSNGIQTEELALRVCNWREECARDAINSLFLYYDNKIEAIISNNDAMAIGAIKALQAYGYNKGDKSKTIPVVGINGIPEALDLINKGYMTGTVVQYPADLAAALYSVGLNLINNRPPLEGTDYKFTTKGLIEMPYYEYKP